MALNLQDLKKYFDSCNGDLDPETVKVREITALDITMERIPPRLLFSESSASQ